MKNAEEGKEFYFHDGSRVRNIKELIEKLKDIDENSFRRYVNREKNDFSNWIRYVLDEQELAIKLLTTLDKDTTIKFLEEYLEKNEKKVEEGVEKGNIVKRKVKETREKLEEKTEKTEKRGKGEVDIKESGKTMNEKEKEELLKPLRDIGKESKRIRSMREKARDKRDKYKDIYKHRSYRELVRELLFKEFMYGVLYGFVLAFIIIAILKALGII